MNHGNYLTFPNTATVRSVWTQFQVLSVSDSIATVLATSASDFSLRLRAFGTGFATLAPSLSLPGQYYQDVLAGSTNTLLNGVAHSASSSSSYLTNTWYAVSGSALISVGSSSSTVSTCSPCSDAQSPINSIGGTSYFGAASPHYARNLDGYMTELLLTSSVMDAASQAALHAYAPQSVARPPVAGGTLAESVIGTSASAAFSTRQLYQDWAGPVVTVRKGSTGEMAELYATGISAAAGYTLALYDGTPYDTWLGGATAYVTQLFDQSLAGRHATQSVAAQQPQLVRATPGSGGPAPYALLFPSNLGNSPAYLSLPAAVSVKSAWMQFKIASIGASSAWTTLFGNSGADVTLRYYTSGGRLYAQAAAASGSGYTYYDDSSSPNLNAAGDMFYGGYFLSDGLFTAQLAYPHLQNWHTLAAWKPSSASAVSVDTIGYACISACGTPSYMANRAFFGQMTELVLYGGSMHVGDATGLYNNAMAGLSSPGTGLVQSVCSAAACAGSNSPVNLTSGYAATSQAVVSAINFGTSGSLAANNVQRFTGYLYSPAAANYTFIASYSRCRYAIFFTEDVNVPTASNWLSGATSTAAPATQATSSKLLAAGQYYLFDLYWNSNGYSDGTLQLQFGTGTVT